MVHYKLSNEINPHAGKEYLLEFPRKWTKKRKGDSAQSFLTNFQEKYDEINRKFTQASNQLKGNPHVFEKWVKQYLRNVAVFFEKINRNKKKVTPDRIYSELGKPFGILFSIIECAFPLGVFPKGNSRLSRGSYGFIISISKEYRKFFRRWRLGKFISRKRTIQLIERTKSVIERKEQGGLQWSYAYVDGIAAVLR